MTSAWFDSHLIFSINFLLTSFCFHVHLLWHSFALASHINIETRWSDIKFQNALSSQKILGERVWNARCLWIAQEPCIFFKHRCSIFWHLQIWLCFLLQYFYVILCQPMCITNFLRRKIERFCSFFFWLLPWLAHCFAGSGHIEMKMIKKKNEEQLCALWTGWSCCWPRGCVFDQSSLYFGGRKPFPDPR